MLNFIKPSILFIGISMLMLQGCGEESSAITYPTTLGDSASITSPEEGAVMIPNNNTLKSISQEVSTILQEELTSFNEKTTIAFDKETNYCHVSGLKKFQNTGTLKQVLSIKKYENCQEEETLQHGKLNIDYRQMNTDGKYPQSLHLKVEETYSNNHIELKKDITVESSITYNENKSIEKITLKINGEITMDSIDYGLLNIEHTINY